VTLEAEMHLLKAHDMCEIAIQTIFRCDIIWLLKGNTFPSTCAASATGLVFLWFCLWQVIRRNSRGTHT